MKKYALAIAFALFACNSAQAAIVLNGGFENGMDAGSFATLSAGSNAIAGWTVASSNADYIGTSFESPSADSGGISVFGLALDNVSITAVPEPGTWALLFAGFIVIGSVMRRRRNVTVSFS